LAAEGRPLRVRLEVEPAVAAISPSVLGEISEVMIQNAHVHGAGTVNVTVRRAGDALTLDVNDQGPGFGPDPDRAFVRGTGEGHGIGLALARSLAHAEGARLQITHPGPGPTVSLLVPPARDEISDGDGEPDPSGTPPTR
jgi:signal transduction histidine kinase